jgi:hypothetical protein
VLLFHIVEVESGRAWPAHGTQQCERCERFNMTGVHPSWAPEPTPPPRARVEDVQRGSVGAQLGMFLVRPGKPLALTIFATIGPYRSNEVRVTVRP